jgi:hypothetical protein
MNLSVVLPVIHESPSGDDARRMPRLERERSPILASEDRQHLVDVVEAFGDRHSASSMSSTMCAKLMMSVWSEVWRYRNISPTWA